MNTSKGIDTPNNLHGATLEQAHAHLCSVLDTFPWTKYKAARIMEAMRHSLNLRACLAEPMHHRPSWYSSYLLRIYVHAACTPSLRRQIEELYEIQP